MWAASPVGTQLAGADSTGSTGKKAVVIVLGGLGAGDQSGLFLSPAFTRTALEANVHSLTGELGCSTGLKYHKIPYAQWQGERSEASSTPGPVGRTAESQKSWQACKGFLVSPG